MNRLNRLTAVCLALPCLAASARAGTYDAPVQDPQILTPPPGPAPAINGPQVHGVRPGSLVIYRIPTTGTRPIRFSYRPGNSEHFHLHEIATDGTGLRRLTDGPFDDIEPAYLPDGGIVFVSSRAKRWVNCWLTQVATLHRCDAEGGNIRPISLNIEHDNTPWVMPDGRILYTRWEYVDRSQVHYHHLWSVNPDGTAPMTWFGNLHPGEVIIDAKPVPRSPRVVCIFSPGHEPPLARSSSRPMTVRSRPTRKPITYQS